MAKRSLSLKLSKFFGRKSSISAKKKTKDVSPAPMSSENPPISEIVVVTEFSRGLGRRIPYDNDETFVGIVNIRYVSVSTRRRSSCSQPFKEHLQQLQRKPEKPPIECRDKSNA